MHCAVVVYSVCHVNLHLGVTSVERRGRNRVSRDPSPWHHLSGAKGAYTPYCGWIVAVSEHQSVCCVRVSLIPTSPCPPSLSSLPPGIQTRELDPMFVNLNTETRNLHSLSLSSLPVGIDTQEFAILITQTTNPFFLAFCCFFQISPWRRYSKYCRILVICV